MWGMVPLTHHGFCNPRDLDGIGFKGHAGLALLAAFVDDATLLFCPSLSSQYAYARDDYREHPTHPYTPSFRCDCRNLYQLSTHLQSLCSSSREIPWPMVRSLDFSIHCARIDMESRATMAYECREKIRKCVTPSDLSVHDILADLPSSPL
jgi:hypothetical protein